MIIDSNLELLTDWQAKTGTDIGGVPPVFYGSTLVNGELYLYTQGTAYSDWLAALKRPILPCTGKLSLAMELWVDPSAKQCAQALEFDTRVSVDGWNYNFSSQILYAKGGWLQISGADNKWVNTPWTVGYLPENKWLSCRWEYKFDAIRHTYGTTVITLDGKVCPIPPQLQGLTAPQPKWADGTYLQIQQDINGQPGQFWQKVRNVQFEWS